MATCKTTPKGTFWNPLPFMLFARINHLGFLKYPFREWYPEHINPLEFWKCPIRFSTTWHTVAQEKKTRTTTQPCRFTPTLLTPQELLHMQDSQGYHLNRATLIIGVEIKVCVCVCLYCLHACNIIRVRNWVHWTINYDWTNLSIINFVSIFSFKGSIIYWVILKQLGSSPNIYTLHTERKETMEEQSDCGTLQMVSNKINIFTTQIAGKNVLNCQPCTDKFLRGRHKTKGN